MRTKILLAILVGAILILAYIVSQPLESVREALENRTPTYSTMQVKPATDYEDCLQCAGNYRNVQNARSNYDDPVQLAPYGGQ